MTPPPVTDPRLDKLRELVDPRLAKLREVLGAMPSFAADATAHPVTPPERVPTMQSASPTPAHLRPAPVPQEHITPLGQELNRLAAPAVGVVEGIQQQAVNLVGRPLLRAIGKEELDHPTLQEQAPEVGTAQTVGRHIGSFAGGALPYVATDGLLAAPAAVTGAVGGAVAGGLESYGHGDNARQVAEAAAKSGIVAGTLGAATKLPALARAALKDIRAAADALPVREASPLLPEGTDRLAKLKELLAARPNLASEAGTAHPSLTGGVAGAGVGAAGGAAADKDHPIRGAIVGGLAGAALGAGIGTAAAKLGRRGGVALEPEPVIATPEELVQAGSRRLPPIEPPAAPAGPPVDPEDYAKIATFALDPSGEEALRKEVARIGPEVIGDPKRVISHAQTRAMAESIGIDDLRASDVNSRLSGPEMLAIRNLVNRNVTILQKSYESLKTNPSPDTDQLIAALEAQNESLLGRFITNRARTGRDLNNMAILAKQSMDPFIWITKAKNLAEQGGRKLTGEQAAEIQRLAEAQDRPGLLKFMGTIAPTTPGQKLLTVWKAGLLTSPTTHLANIAGNTAMAGLETAKDAPAAMVDRLLSTVTGQRTTGFAPVLVARASMQGARDGVREAKLTLRGIPTGGALVKGEIPREVHFNNPILDAYTKGIFRTLDAQDRVFYQLALKRSLANQAGALAKQAGRTAADLLAHPTDAMAIQAARDAEYATFRETTPFTRGVMGARRAMGPVGEVVMPFAKTPTNIATTVLDYTPVGGLKSAANVVRLFKAVAKGASPEEVATIQRLASQQAGRAATGTLPILVGYTLASKGLATGATPASKTGRDEQNLEGKQPNAVLLNGKWRAVTRVSPIGNLIALGANLYEITHNTQLSGVEKAAATGASVGTTITESPFFQGVDQVIGAVKDPVNEGGRYATNLATSIVPNAVKRVARGTDPVVRETHGIGDAFANAMPGLSRSLPAKVDQLGQTVSRDQGLAGALFDPMSSRTDRRTDPVIKALAATGAQIPALKRQPGESERGFALRSRVDGERVRQALVGAILSPRYKAAPPEEQAALLEYTARRVRASLTRSRR